MTNDATAPGFLAALAAVARHENFSIQIGADAAQMRVSIQVEGHEPLVAFGPPAALDQQLPEAIAQYAHWIGARIAKDEVKITLPGRPKSSAPNPQRKKAIARKKPVVRRKPAAKSAPKKKAPPRRAPAVKHRQAAAPAAGKPGKAECIADLKALRARFGDELTRRGFIKQAKTGRRYEKLWKNWEDFTAEALGKSAAACARKPAAPAPSTTAAPKAKKPAKTPAAAKDDKSPWALKVKGKQIGATIFEKKPGDTIALSQGSFIVQSVDTDKREIQIEPVAKASAPPAPTVQAPATAVKKQTPYAIKTAEGTTLGAIVKELAIGNTWGPFDRWEVTAIDHDKREYTVKDRTAAAASVPPATEQKPATTETTT